MKIWNNKTIFIRYYGTKLISYTYLGLNLIWSAIRSCFSSGRWRDDKIWDDEESWKDD